MMINGAFLLSLDMYATACNEMWCKNGQMKDLSKLGPFQASFS